jgi:hypothetical protein
MIPTRFDGVNFDTGIGFTVYHFGSMHPVSNTSTGTLVTPIVEVNVANHSGLFGGDGFVTLTFALSGLSGDDDMQGGFLIAGVTTYTCAWYVVSLPPFCVLVEQSL